MYIYIYIHLSLSLFMCVVIHLTIYLYVETTHHFHEASSLEMAVSRLRDELRDLEPASSGAPGAKRGMVWGSSKTDLVLGCVYFGFYVGFYANLCSIVSIYVGFYIMPYGLFPKLRSDFDVAKYLLRR